MQANLQNNNSHNNHEYQRCMDKNLTNATYFKTWQCNAHEWQMWLINALRFPAGIIGEFMLSTHMHEQIEEVCVLRAGGVVWGGAWSGILQEELRPLHFEAPVVVQYPRPLTSTFKGLDQSHLTSCCLVLTPRCIATAWVTEPQATLPHTLAQWHPFFQRCVCCCWLNHLQPPSYTYFKPPSPNPHPHCTPGFPRGSPVGDCKPGL